MSYLTNLSFILVGARSGKSEAAEELATALDQPIYYLATMNSQAVDEETHERICRHVMRRPKAWTTIEVNHNLAQFIDNLPKTNLTCIIDCLSLYVSNMLLDSEALNYLAVEELILNDINKLMVSIKNQESIHFIIVSNEVGLSLVPMAKVGRYFRDILGLSNKIVAKHAHRVYFTLSGISLKIR